MKLIEVTVMTLDRNYPGTIDGESISVMVRMPKYTYVELSNGSKYKVLETPKEILKRLAGGSDAPKK